TNNLYYIVNGVGGEDLELGGSSGGAVLGRHTGEFGAVRIEATETNMVCHFITINDVIVDTLALGNPLWTPFIVAPPSSQTVPLGSLVTFAVQAAGPGPLRYQWRSPNGVVPNATNRTYTIPAASFSDEGDYTVTVSSGGTSIASRPGTLTVL